MLIFRTVHALQEHQKNHSFDRVGFIPTMGFLHEGHLSLIRRAKSECSFVIVSIFVNPLQFTKREQYESYPSNLEKDCGLLSACEVDGVFIPESDDILSEKNSLSVHPGPEGALLCGEYRPDHFQGVLSILLILFNIICPDRVYFGLKDYQQLWLVKAMVKFFYLPLSIVGCPTVREKDGLALSSRNSLLRPDERTHAYKIYKALTRAGDSLKKVADVSIDNIIDELRKDLQSIPHSVYEYAEICDAATIKKLTKSTKQYLLVTAIRFKSSRLIDNLIVNKEL